jgi:hypothetical protein
MGDLCSSLCLIKFDIACPPLPILPLEDTGAIDNVGFGGNCGGGGLDCTKVCCCAIEDNAAEGTGGIGGMGGRFAVGCIDACLGGGRNEVCVVRADL